MGKVAQRFAERQVALSRRAAILNFQRQIEALPTEGVQVGDELIVPVKAGHCPVKHHFAKGSYGREMFLPKGTKVVGQIHKHSHVNVISQGHVRVFTEHDGVQELVAPITFVSSPGTKRVVDVLEDTIWTTVHVTDKTDLAEIAKEVIADDFEGVHE